MIKPDQHIKYTVTDPGVVRKLKRALAESRALEAAAKAADKRVVDLTQEQRQAALAGAAGIKVGDAEELLVAVDFKAGTVAFNLKG